MMDTLNWYYGIVGKRDGYRYSDYGINNYENFIEETLNSIKNQSYQDFEIIIVDDFSTDNSLNIITSLENPLQNYYIFFKHTNIN